MNLRSFTIQANFGAQHAARRIVEAVTDPVTDLAPLRNEISRQLGDAEFDLLVWLGRFPQHYYPIEPATSRIEHRQLVLRQTAAHCTAPLDMESIDAESPHELSRLVREVSGKRTLLILDFALEVVWDIRPLLSSMRSVLLSNPANKLLIRHLDSEHCDASLRFFGYREWTRAEMRHLLQQAGFDVASNPCDAAPSAEFSIQSVTCTPQHYSKFLRTNNLPPPDIRSLHVTTEHTDFGIMGGIGTYAELLTSIVPHYEMGMIFVPFGPRRTRAAYKNPHLITLSKFFDEDDVAKLPLQDAALEVVNQVLHYYPDIRRIEYQDYLGLGSRLVHARESGLLPPDVRLEVIAHGGQVYIESAQGVWSSAGGVELATHERIALERSDRVIFPSRFLRNLYVENGIELAESRVVYHGYPFIWGQPPEDVPFEPLDTIIFLGKRSRMKGYVDLLKALERLRQLGGVAIRNTIFLTPQGPIDSEAGPFLARIRKEMTVTFASGTRSEIGTILSSHRGHSLCVMPYVGDNSPYAVREVIDAGCPLLCYAAGGTAELFPAELSEQYTCNPTVEDLARAILERTAQDPAIRRANIARLRESWLHRQMEVDQEIRSRFRHVEANGEKPRPAGKSLSVTAESPITVIIPAFNIPKRFLEDLFYGLRRQTLPPFEIVLSDDGSAPEFAAGYSAAIHDSGLSVRVVRTEMNRGLAAARNRALELVRTPYLANVDADDIPLPRFLDELVNYLANNSQVCAAGHYLQSFEDGTDWRHIPAEINDFSPLGEGLALGYVKNCLGHADSGFVTDELRAVGGWDETDRSMWEDWALYIKLVSMGKRLGVIPKTGVLIRHRRDSMRRTYARFSAEARLGRAIAHDQLPLHEARRLIGLLSNLRAATSPMEDDSEMGWRRVRDTIRRPTSLSGTLLFTHGVYAPSLQGRRSRTEES